MSHANTPSQQELDQQSLPVLETAKAFVIDSPFMYEQAGEEVKSIKAKIKALEDQRKAITQPMDQAKKQVMDLFKKPVEVLEQAESFYKRSMLGYQQEQRRIEQEAQRKADEAAAAERKRMEEMAKEAAKSGDEGTAVAMQAAAEMVTAPAVKVAPAKLSGISTSVRWSAEVTDKVAYMKHVLEHPELIETIQIDMKPLNQMAVALKDKLALPGIKVVSNESMSVRA